MKARSFALTGIALLTMGAIGCGTTTPPSQLVDARTAYQRASNARGAPLVAPDLHDARQALMAAEKKFEEDGDEASTRNLAYVAQRRAVAVEARASALQSLNDKRTAEADFKRFKDERNMAARRELASTKEQLSGERAARTAAEDKTKDLLAQVEGLKTAQTDRGLVLTLSGNVLFATGKSELLPAAKSRLNEVATAIKNDKRELTVVGHTDSVGPDESNMKLSEARAAAVRTYLVSQGVDSSHIRSEGMGETQPIADNTSPEGRANNRRVEIVLGDTGKAATRSNANAPSGSPNAATAPAASSAAKSTANAK